MNELEKHTGKIMTKIYEWAVGLDLFDAEAASTFEATKYALRRHAILTKRGVTELSFSGSLTNSALYSVVLRSLPNEAVCVSRCQSTSSVAETFVWDTGEAELRIEFENVLTMASLRIASMEDECLIKISEAFKSCAASTEGESPSNNGEVHILTQSAEGITARRLGYASTPLARDNYNDEVLGHIDKAIEAISSPSPSGRLVIIEGPPGGGKTFLVRSLIQEASESSFVFVPPSLIPNLGDPSLVGSLIDMARGGAGSCPIVLICEDADSILTRRAMDNMAAISSLLNVTSGIMGEVLDVRVVATTNAVRSDIDLAILRPGRLGSYVSVQALSEEKAKSILARLLGEEVTEEIDWPLTGDALDKPKRSGVGFSSGAKAGNKDILLASVYAEARRRGYIVSSESNKYKDVVPIVLPNSILRLAHPLFLRNYENQGKETRKPTARGRRSIRERTLNIMGR